MAREFSLWATYAASLLCRHYLTILNRIPQKVQQLSLCRYLAQTSGSGVNMSFNVIQNPARLLMYVCKAFGEIAHLLLFTCLYMTIFYFHIF